MSALISNSADREVTVSRGGYLATVSVHGDSVFEQVVEDASDAEVHVAAFHVAAPHDWHRDADRLGDYASSVLATVIRERGRIGG